MRWSIGFVCIASLISSPVFAQGLKGLGGKGILKGGGLLSVDPKAVAFERELLGLLNELRGEVHEPLVSNASLVGFSRGESVRIAKSGAKEMRTSAGRIKKRNLAPHGHYIRFAYGAQAKAIVGQLKADSAWLDALTGDFAEVGIGAHWVDDPGFFQVTVLLARNPDPMLGKPGLSMAQTDPVMHETLPAVKVCYDKALTDNPNLSGKAIFKIVIGQDGAVKSTAVSKSIGHIGFDECAVLILRGLKFPRPYKGKPVVLKHPFAFNPPQGDRRLGKLKERHIRQAFRGARNDFVACYDRRLKAKPNLAGNIELSLTVLPNGRVSQLRTSKDEPGDLPLTSCILKRAQRIRFPKPKFGGEVDLVYPVSFAKGL